MSIRVPLLAAGLLFATTTTFAEDWPAFRGPNRDGICKETGLLKEWPKDGPKVAWTATKLGIGHSTPTVAKGMIFGMSTRDGKDGIWAIQEADGKELWFTPFEKGYPPRQGMNNGPNSSPTYDDGFVYAVSSIGKLICVDAAKGEKKWDREYKEFGGKTPGWGYSDSILVDGDKVICVPCGSKAGIVALDKKTGQDVWKSEIPGGSSNGGGYCSPEKVTLAGTPMYVVLMGSEAGVVGVSPKDGTLLWQYKGKGANGGTAQIPIPIIAGNNVWVSCSYGNGGSALLKIEADGSEKFKATPIKTHQKRDLNNHHGGMVKVGDYAYFGHEQNDGKPVCVDLKTGEIKWGPEKVSPAGGNRSAAVLAFEDRIIFRYENGVVALIEASPEKLKVVSSFKEADRTGKESWAHPVIANGKMYLRDQDKLTCYEMKAAK